MAAGLSFPPPGVTAMAEQQQARGEPYLRICFARKADDMREVASRLTTWLNT